MQPNTPVSLRRPAPWGVVRVILLTVLVMAVQTVVWLVAMMIVDAVYPGQAPAGMRTLVGLLVGTPPAIWLVWRLAHVQQQRPAKAYLALKPVGGATLAKWLAAGVGLVIVAELARYFGGQPLVPHNSLVLYTTAGWLPLFVVAIVVVGPVFEELLVRGLLFQGLADTRLGVRGAVVISALLWALPHIQYNAFDIATIFAMGLFLGYARHATGSLWPCLAIHVLNNVISTIETAVLVFLGHG
jgi:CAAX protease family protein